LLGVGAHELVIFNVAELKRRSAVGIGWVHLAPFSGDRIVIEGDEDHRGDQKRAEERSRPVVRLPASDYLVSRFLQIRLADDDGWRWPDGWWCCPPFGTYHRRGTANNYTLWSLGSVARAGGSMSGAMGSSVSVIAAGTSFRGAVSAVRTVEKSQEVATVEKSPGPRPRHEVSNSTSAVLPCYFSCRSGVIPIAGAFQPYS
jgi:hypothetical protein